MSGCDCSITWDLKEPLSKAHNGNGQPLSKELLNKPMKIQPGDVVSLFKFDFKKPYRNSRVYSKIYNYNGKNKLVNILKAIESGYKKIIKITPETEEDIKEYLEYFAEPYKTQNLKKFKNGTLRPTDLLDATNTYAGGLKRSKDGIWSFDIMK